MLREDHRKIQELFEQFENADGNEAKKHIAEQALNELEVHAALEEELFYPAVRKEIGEESKIDEAEEEHHVVKLLASELEKMDPEDERYSAKFKVLAESVKHHIQEEESNVIPEVEGVLDGATLGERMAQRKEQLQQEGGSSRKGPSRSAGRRSSGRRKAKKSAKSGSRR
jgi:hemerythrin-like domain-containing protein